MITFQDLQSLYGSHAQIAAAFDVSTPTVYGWEKNVPFARQLQVQMRTGGKLIASEKPRKQTAEQVAA
jgi:hypothetical protein